LRDFKLSDMPEAFCPNYSSCKLVKPSGLGLTEKLRQQYLDTYCTTEPACWESCKRFQCREILHFCPDFVLPDTDSNVDEIIDQFDNN